TERKRRAIGSCGGCVRESPASSRPPTSWGRSGWSLAYDHCRNPGVDPGRCPLQVPGGRPDTAVASEGEPCCCGPRAGATISIACGMDGDAATAGATTSCRGPGEGGAGVVGRLASAAASGAAACGAADAPAPAHSVG